MFDAPPSKRLIPCLPFFGGAETTARAAAVPGLAVRVGVAAASGLSTETFFVRSSANAAS
jgi:hypothetical protein